MMKLNRLGILLILAGMVLSSNLSYAIVDVKATTIGDIEVQKPKKVSKQPAEPQPAYTNEVHSVFTLDDCINIAIKYNPAIQSYLANEQVYKARIGQEWANYFPALSAGVQGQIGSTNYSSTNYVNDKNALGYIPKLSAEMLIFDFGKTKASADRAKSIYQSKEFDTSENINVLICNIKEAYFNILFAQKQVSVYKDTVADYALQLKRAQSFYETGKKAKIDVITAEYNLGKAKLNLVKAENVLEVANVELARIMGIPEYTNYELSSELSTLKYTITQDEAVRKAYTVRPELIAARKVAEAAKLNLRAKKRAYTPNIGAFASYNNGLGTEYNISSYQVGVGLNYSALNLAKVKKQVDEAEALYAQSVADLEDKKHGVFLNVATQYLELKTNEEAIVIAKLALDEAREQYRQVSGRYKAGVGDYIELKDGETTYLNARLDFYNSLLNYNVTAAKLEKEIGAPLLASNDDLLKDLMGQGQK